MDRIKEANHSDHHTDETITTLTTTIISIINKMISQAITWAAEIICTEAAEDQCHHEAAAIQAILSTTEAQEDQDQMAVDEDTEKINQRMLVKIFIFFFLRFLFI
jgi:hypothetical protein